MPPHYPGNEQERDRDTHAKKSRFGNLVPMRMQFHISQHLQHRIPLTLTSAAYRELHPILSSADVNSGGSSPKSVVGYSTVLGLLL